LGLSILFCLFAVVDAKTVIEYTTTPHSNYTASPQNWRVSPQVPFFRCTLAPVLLIAQSCCDSFPGSSVLHPPPGQMVRRRTRQQRFLQDSIRMGSHRDATSLRWRRQGVDEPSFVGLLARDGCQVALYRGDSLVEHALASRQ
jgi:hypothetical protein